ncbi:LysR family transcriptional regulator [Phenylobacterium sp. LjRoot164]|uniref:LysR family transcriptional regulator n=1 Tax=unclassified Phenylobacterium TaxID=2640670 RepID=UPI003ECF2154
MRREDLGGLAAFVAVAEERSFTRAAARMGTSQSALSQTVKRLEARLGVRLLTRTTRSVAVTEAGEQLLASLRFAFDEIETQLVALGELRDRPAGTIRITAGQHAADTVLFPVIAQLLPDYPDVNVELSIDTGFRDIVADRFDAGVRLGEQVEKDMIAVRIGPDLRMALVAAPAYFEQRPAPRTPHDLTGHNCINLRFPTLGGLYAWEFEKDGRELNVRVEGQLVFNETRLIVRAACAGLGLAYILEDHVAEHLADGRLVRALEDWCPPFSGYHLYYPSRRQHTPAFALLVEALRSRS